MKTVVAWLALMLLVVSSIGCYYVQSTAPATPSDRVPGYVAPAPPGY